MKTRTTRSLCIASCIHLVVSSSPHVIDSYNNNIYVLFLLLLLFSLLPCREGTRARPVFAMRACVPPQTSPPGSWRPLDGAATVDSCTGRDMRAIYIAGKINYLTNRLRTTIRDDRLL